VLLAPLGSLADANPSAVIERIKPSIVAVGTFERLRNPQFNFHGTGFVVGDGRLVATNEHVVAKPVDTEKGERLVIAVRGPQNNAVVRSVHRVASDAGSDIALLRFEGGPPLPALELGDGEGVREGETYLFTGFPIGAVLGLVPVTHRAMIAAITPIVMPAGRSDQLDARAVRRIAAGSFSVYQLDGTAYPGNSGSPVYHPGTGAVIAIVNSVFVKGTRESALSAPSGITYAIPAQKLKELLERHR
jgi:S1-C subfamily serine protease